MRTAFIRTLEDLAGKDSRINLIVGDVGFKVVESFAKRFPKQFINVGIAEQNMVGLAVGLALEGRVVFTYSIGNFPTLRCLEQIRNDVCYHKANVKIVAIGGGLTYGPLGSSHHATEDLAIMRSLPEMVVLAPGDPREAEAAVLASAAHKGPCYIRLGKAGEPTVHATNPDFELGRSITLREGTDLTIFSTGAMLAVCHETAEALQEAGIGVRLISMHTIKPLDSDAVRRAALETGGIVTIEEHSIVGGLGSAVAETLAQLPEVPRIPFRIIGLPDDFCRAVGSQTYLRNLYGLTVSSLVKSCESLVSETGRNRSAKPQ
jgi:transketolase